MGLHFLLSPLYKISNYKNPHFVNFIFFLYFNIIISSNDTIFSSYKLFYTGSLMQALFHATLLDIPVADSLAQLSYAFS